MYIVQSLAGIIQQLESQLEVEQEKLATLIRNLSMDASQRKREREPEEVISEEWLQSLKERRKVCINKETLTSLSTLSAGIAGV